MIRRAKFTRMNVELRNAVASWIRLEKRRVDDGELRLESRNGCFRRDEEMMREEIVPRKFAIDANRHAIALVGADVAIECVHVAFGEIGFDLAQQCIEDAGIDRTIRVAPIDVRFTRWFANERFVFRRAARVRAGIDDELAVTPKDALTAPQRMFHQLRGREILPQIRGFEFFRNGKNRRNPRGVQDRLNVYGYNPWEAAPAEPRASRPAPPAIPMDALCPPSALLPHWPRALRRP